MFKVAENVNQLVAVQPECAVKSNLFDAPTRSIYISSCGTTNERS